MLSLGHILISDLVVANLFMLVYHVDISLENSARILEHNIKIIKNARTS